MFESIEFFTWSLLGELAKRLLMGDVSKTSSLLDLDTPDFFKDLTEGSYLENEDLIRRFSFSFYNFYSSSTFFFLYLYISISFAFSS